MTDEEAIALVEKCLKEKHSLTSEEALSFSAWLKKQRPVRQLAIWMALSHNGVDDPSTINNIRALHPTMGPAFLNAVNGEEDRKLIDRLGDDPNLKRWTPDGDRDGSWMKQFDTK